MGRGRPPTLLTAAFISLAELGVSCNKPLSTFPFSYVFFIQASRLAFRDPVHHQLSQIDLIVYFILGEL